MEVILDWQVYDMLIKTKYNGQIELDLYLDALIKSVFKILPMWEKQEDWQKYLKGLQIELSGLNELSNSVSFISLIAKLEGLFFTDDKELIKKVVFDSISLINKIKKEGEKNELS